MSEKSDFLNRTTLFFTNLSGEDEEALKKFLCKCCEKIGIEVPNFVINLVKTYNKFTEQYVRDFGYIHCVNPLLYRMILNLDENFEYIESDFHLLGEDLFIMEEGIFFSSGKEYTFKAYNADFYYKEGHYTNVISSSVKIEKRNEQLLINEVRKLVKIFSTSDDDKYPYVTISRTRNFKFVNVEFSPETDDGIFSLPFLYRPKVKVQGKELILFFSPTKDTNY